MKQHTKEAIKFKFPSEEKLTTIKEQLADCAHTLEDYGGLSILKKLFPEEAQEELDAFIDLETLEINEDFSDFMVAKKLKARFSVIKNTTEEAEKSIADSEETFADDLVEFINNKHIEADKKLTTNVKRVLERLKPLERSYSSAQILFANAGKAGSEIERLHFVNATMKQLQKKSKSRNKTNFAYTIQETLKTGYDDSDLSANYSIFQIAGFLGEGLKDDEAKVVIERWAKTANDNKVLLFTDFKECNSLQELKNFQKLKYASTTNQDLRSVVLCGNYGITRKKINKYESKDFTIPPSSILVGLSIENESIAQAKGGAVFGKTREILGANNNAYYSEAQEIRNKGLNVLYFSKAAKQTHVEGNTTLYINEKDLTNKQTSVIRTKLFVEKFMRNYSNKITFAGINSLVTEIAESKIIDALQDLREEGLIVSFSNISAAQNPRKKSQLKISMNIEFVFAAEEIKLDIISD